MVKKAEGGRRTTIPIKEQVTSLELSKRLKKLGANQDSYLYWAQNVEKKKWKVFPSDWLKHFHNPEEEKYSAFTVAELGEMLPARIKTDYGSWTYLHITKLENTKEWLISYNPGDNDIMGTTEADARAKMLIFLIENKLMEANK